MPSIKVRVAARGGSIPHVIITKMAHHTNSKITMVALGTIVVAPEDEAVAVATTTSKARQDSTSTTIVDSRTLSTNIRPSPIQSTVLNSRRCPHRLCPCQFLSCPWMFSSHRADQWSTSLILKAPLIPMWGNKWSETLFTPSLLPKSARLLLVKLLEWCLMKMQLTSLNCSKITVTSTGFSRRLPIYMDVKPRTESPRPGSWLRTMAWLAR